MLSFLKLPTIFAIIAGTFSFGAGIFLFVQVREPVILAIEDTPFVPIAVVDTLFAPTPLLPEKQEVPEVKEEIITEEPSIAEIVPITIPVVQEIITPLPPVIPSFIPKDLEVVHKQVQKALVNILCLADASSPLGSISGSGIMIDPSGTILTNAHIAQHLLLKDYPEKDSIVCTVRIGSPAIAAYIADLAYISPLWVTENKDAITKTNPTGTGKDDFALLTITGPSQFGKIPETFPYLPVTFDEASIGLTVLTAGYPASFLSSAAIQRNLVQIAAAGSVLDVFTFNKLTVDVLSLGGVPLAQQGASGGAVVRSDGSLIGLVVTSSLEEDTQERDLRAISTGHIARSFAGQHQTNFSAYAFGDITPRYVDFQENILPQLRDLLLQVLGKI